MSAKNVKELVGLEPDSIHLWYEKGYCIVLANKASMTDDGTIGGIFHRCQHQQEKLANEATIQKNKGILCGIDGTGTVIDQSTGLIYLDYSSCPELMPVACEFLETCECQVCTCHIIDRIKEKSFNMGSIDCYEIRKEDPVKSRNSKKW